LIVSISHRPWKPLIIRLSMTIFAVAMLLMAVVHVPWIAFVLFGIMGACTIIQFNTTNTLFQLISPPMLRGRVLSMHMWAVMGVSPFGTLFFGWFAGVWSLQAAFGLGGIALAIGAVCSWVFKDRVYEPELQPL
jgi:MFS family permease